MGNDFGWICMWTNAIPAEIHGNFIKKIHVTRMVAWKSVCGIELHFRWPEDGNFIFSQYLTMLILK